MIYIGNDIVKNSRIDRLINIYGDKFLNKIFSLQEIELVKNKRNSISYSGKFAAKEASAKALLSSDLIKRVSLKDIEILNKKDGAPFIQLNNVNLVEVKSFKISISHTNQYSTAFALLELFDS